MKTIYIKAFWVLFLVSRSFILIAQERMDKPNIIIILADDLGWGDVGFHGSEIRTPNLDQLAKEGVILNRFYTAPVCSPTRAGLMTGRYPNRFGLRETVIPPWSEFGVDTNELFLPVFLKDAGYHNRVVLGKWHLGHAQRAYLPLQRGFTKFYGHYNGAIDYFTHFREGELDWHDDEKTSTDKGYSTDLISDKAVEVIRNAGDKPFFMYVAYNAPHTPLQAKPEDLKAYGYSTEKPTARQTYAAMVTCMDRGIGRILNSLKAMKKDQNTIVLFFSDNGANVSGGGSSGQLKGHKFQEWDGGVRAPAIAKWPARLKGGTKTEQVMGYVDVLPTLLGITGASSKNHRPFDGIDISPVLFRKQDQINRNLYLGYGSLISSPWKIVLAKNGNAAMKLNESALFNIIEDPAEKQNIKNSKQEVFKQLSILARTFDSIRSEVTVAPYAEGKKGFKAPKDWLIKN